MKKIFLGVFILLYSLALFSQGNDKPTEVTDAIRKKIESEIEKQLLQLKSAMEKKENDKIDIEFALDTARIQIYSDKYMAYDYSTLGMNTAMYEATQKYDKLLNKYYQKLMGVLSTEDKQLLTQSQRAWISFRDSEIKLIQTLSQEKYSGGGTIQTINVSSMVFDITRSRLNEIFQHYRWTQQIEPN